MKYYTCRDCDHSRSTPYTDTFWFCDIVLPICAKADNMNVARNAIINPNSSAQGCPCFKEARNE